MIKVGDKEWRNLPDEEKISYCEGLLTDTVQSREPRDLEWYLNYMFGDGNHYLTVNTTTNTLQPQPPKKRGEVRMVVNKIKSSIRAVQNYSTYTRPKWEIIPGDTDEDTIVNARRIGKTMDYIYRKLHLEQMVNGVVDSGLNTSVGWVEVDWDSEAEKGLGEVRVRLHDPFDVWVDKRSYLYSGRVVGRFIAKTVSRSEDEVKNDNKYDKKNRKEVTIDEEPAVSRLKAKIIRREGVTEDKTIPRVTVKEFFLWDDGGNEKKGKIWLFTYAGGKVLRDEPLENKEFPLYVYQISMNPLKIYQRAWVSDAVPLNKALDRTLSQKIMYVNQALKFTIIAEKGHGTAVATNEIGDVIEVNRGRQFQQMAINPLPSGFDSLNMEISTYIEDILGAHDAALGRLPAGARSGKTLEALQAADANNLTGITQSLESFLSVIGERILEIVADKYVTSRIVKISEPEEGQEFLKVVGKNGPKLEGATIITGDNEIIVKIGSWLGYTREAQRETLLKLAELGILDGSEILRQFEFPNIEELSAKAREQRLEQHKLDAEIAGRTQGTGEEQGANEDMIAMADDENMRMMNGEQIPPTEGATPDHSQAHRDFINSRTFQTASPDIQQLLVTHYQGEVGGGNL